MVAKRFIFIYSFNYLSIWLFIYLFVYLFIYLFICLTGEKKSIGIFQEQLPKRVRHLHETSLLKRLSHPRKSNNNNSQNHFTFSFKNCFQCLSFRIEQNSNSIKHTHSNAKLCCCPGASDIDRNNIPIYEC